MKSAMNVAAEMMHAIEVATEVTSTVKENPDGCSNQNKNLREM